LAIWFNLSIAQEQLVSPDVKGEDGGRQVNRQDFEGAVSISSGDQDLAIWFNLSIAQEQLVSPDVKGEDGGRQVNRQDFEGAVSISSGDQDLAIWFNLSIAQEQLVSPDVKGEDGVNRGESEGALVIDRVERSEERRATAGHASKSNQHPKPNPCTPVARPLVSTTTVPRGQGISRPRLVASITSLT